MNIMRTLASRNGERGLEEPEEQEERKIHLHCLAVGKDHQVMITGGDAHVGAVALAEPYSTGDGENLQKKSTGSVLAAHGHKEPELALQVASLMSKILQTRVAVTMGIHFDNLSRDEIGAIVKLVLGMASDCCTQIKQKNKKQKK